MNRHPHQKWILLGTMLVFCGVAGLLILSIFGPPSLPYDSPFGPAATTFDGPPIEHRPSAELQLNNGLHSFRENRVSEAIEYWIKAYETASDEQRLLKDRVRSLIGGAVPLLGTPLVNDSGTIDVAFSHDGQRAIIGCVDNTAQLWDVKRVVPIGQLMVHDYFIDRVIFSPADDVVVTTGGSNVLLWDAKTGAALGAIKHGDEIRATAFSPDGKRMVTAGPDAAQVWETHTQRRRWWLATDESDIRAVAFSPDGARLATGDAAGTVQVWSVETGEPVSEVFEHTDMINTIAFSPNGRILLTASNDGTACLWGVDMGERVGEPMGHDGAIRQASFSPDGFLVLTGSDDQTARLWNARDGSPLSEPIPCSSWVTSAEFSSDGRIILTQTFGFSAGAIQLWETEGAIKIRDFDASLGQAHAAVFSPDGTKVLVTTGDSAAQLCDVDLRANSHLEVAHTDAVTSVAFHPSGTMILTGSRDTTARLWDARTLEPHGQTLKHTAPVTAVAFSPDGKTILTASENRKAQRWDLETCKPHGEPVRQDGAVTDVAFSPDGKLVCTASLSTALLWNAATGEPVGRPMTHDGAVVSIAFGGSDLVVTGCDDGSIRRWDLSGTPRDELGSCDAAVQALAIGPDGETVFAGIADSTLWRFDPGSTVAVEHDNRITSLACSSDGLRILTGSTDHTAQLWDAHSLVRIGRPMKHGKPVLAVALSPNGQQVLTGCADGVARLWAAPPLAPDDASLLRQMYEVRMGIAPSRADWLRKQRSLDAALRAIKQRDP